MRLAATLLALVLSLALATPAQADIPPPPTSDAPPDAPVPGPLPAGVNDWNCHSASRPVPLVLVHATFANAFDNWFTMVPALRRAGHCVYALNYGGAPNGLVQGMGDISVSARQLAAFVRQVRSETGAAKVDLVGHSQGGMMPRYYLKNLGGAKYVRHLVGIAPSNAGTDTFGLAQLARDLGLINLSGYVCYSCYQQIAGSDFLTALNAGGQTVPGVAYTVIATKYDEVVTPYSSQFLKGKNVHNILIQNVCPNETSEHLLLAFSTVTQQLVANALAPANAQKPIRCNF